MNSFEKKWQTVSEMAHEARENGGVAYFPVGNGYPRLKLCRQGPVTRFYIGVEEVSGADFADAVEAQSAPDQATEGDDLIAAYSELPAADLTKREMAEIHVLAGVLASFPGPRAAVDRAVEAVRILMDEWQERDTDA